MNVVREILKYMLIYVVCVAVLFGVLVIVAKIPKEAIQDNMKASVDFFKKNDGCDEIYKRREYSTLHYYADSMLLNIIYSIDSEHPIQSVMWDKYYFEIYADINNDFINVVEEDLAPNQEYLRYWHGSMVIVRPLLVFFNIEQIYLLNKVVMYGLAFVLLILLFRKSKKVAFIFLVALFVVAFPIVPFCLEYSWTFYTMLIASIIAIQIEKKGDKGLYILFLITGIITCFLDFLTTEIITLLVPVLLVLLIRKEEGRITGFKECFKFVTFSCALWAVVYVGMWLTKWTLASLILRINPMEYVKDRAMLRINGLQGLKSRKEMYKGALYNNWHNLYPINIVKNKKHLLIYTIVFFSSVAILLDWKNINKKWFAGILMLIAITPYVRYLVLANHSYRHSMFTFRTQIITVIAVIEAILETLNYRLLFKEINWRKNWKR